MKRLIISAVGIGCLVVLIHGCAKKTISGDSSNLVLGSYITLDSTINGILDVGNANSTVSIKIAKSVGTPISTINIYVATGAISVDTTAWKFIKSVPYSAGVVLSVSTAELAKALGSAPAPGNNYLLQNQVVTTDGRRFSVYNTPSTYASLAGYNMALTWSATAVCAFTGNMAGDYYLTQDDWDDYGASASNPVLIPGAIKDGPGANQISIYVYPGKPAGGVETGPMIVSVDPVTGKATIVQSDIGNYGSPSSETIVTGGGFVFDCAGVVNLKVNFNYGGSLYSNQGMILQKTP